MMSFESDEVGVCATGPKFRPDIVTVLPRVAGALPDPSTFETVGTSNVNAATRVPTTAPTVSLTVPGSEAAAPLPAA